MSQLAGYCRNVLRWRGGRQASGYEKMLLLQLPWPVPCDMYLLRFPEGSDVPAHTDPVREGQHYRLNIILRRARKGGEFICADAIYNSERIKYFRPDQAEHAVSRIVRGTRLVLSFGWVRQAQ